MAGQSSSRKQWRLFRGPKGNIQSLGWAEFGCPDSQVKLAKELLEENGEESIDKDEKCCLGVYWLLKASEKGHEEATRMLQDCLDSGTGITEHNISDVRYCLEMPKGEKLSREAAKELFLSLSQGEHYITSNQLLRETLKYSEGPTPLEAGIPQERMVFEKGCVEKLTEEMVISFGSQHLRGELPEVLNRHFMRSSPLNLATMFLARLVQLLSPVYFFLLLAILGVRFVLDTAPAIIYYSSFTFMVLSTCQVLSKKWEFTQFQRWSYALVASGCSEKVSAQAQWAHCTKNCHYFFVFAISLIINLMSSSYVFSIPYSEIVTLSTLISLYMLYNLTKRRRNFDGAIILIFVIHLLARCPYEIDTLVHHYWRYLDVHVPTFTSFIIGSNIKFCLNFRVLLYLMLPGFFLKIASRDKWLGVFTTLLPHLVCLSWWQLAVTASYGATYFGLIRSCFGLLLFILFLPLSSISSLFVSFLALAKFFITEKISIPVALGGFIVTSAVYAGAKLKIRLKLFKFLQVVLVSFSLLLILNCSEIEPVEKSNLNWTDLKNTCDKGDIQNQERCAAFKGLPVTWEGRVLSTQLSSVFNPLESFIKSFPENLQRQLICIFGERIQRCGNKEECTSFIEYCKISNWNRYEYKIEVDLSEDGWTESSTIGWLKVGQSFRNFTLALRQGDRIWFSGTLVDYKVSQPFVSLVHAKCLSCALTVQDVLEVQPQPISLLFFERLFLFFFSPVGSLPFYYD